MKCSQADRIRRDEAVMLSPEAAMHLFAAAEEMDLLLAADRVDAGLGHLVALLGHLRVIRELIA